MDLEKRSCYGNTSHAHTWQHTEAEQYTQSHVEMVQLGYIHVELNEQSKKSRVEEAIEQQRPLPAAATGGFAGSKLIVQVHW